MNLKTTSLGLVLVLFALIACKKKKAPDPVPAPPASVPAATPQASAAVPAAASSPAPAGTRAAAPAVDERGIPPIPAGRSKPPTVAEWSAAAEVNTQGANSQAQDCYMKVVREWIRVHCDGDIKSVSDKDGLPKSNADYFESIKPSKDADFVFRLEKGRTMKMRIHRDGNRASLFINWPASKDRPVHIALSQIKE